MFTVSELLHAAQEAYMPAFKGLAGLHGASRVISEYAKEWHQAALGFVILKLRNHEARIARIEAALAKAEEQPKREIETLDFARPQVQLELEGPPLWQNRAKNR